MEVVALCRPGSDTRFLMAQGCMVVPGDLGDAPELHASRMEGCAGLVHAAARLYGSPSLDVAREVNVEGTRRVLEGGALAGVGRGIHVSSVAVYGNLPGPMTEDLPLHHPLPLGDLYGRTKREAEAVARELHGRGGLQVTILRPPALYGERDRYLLPRLLRWVRRPVVVLPGPGRRRMAAVYAGNLAQAVEKALGGAGGGEIFNVTRDVDVTLRSLCEGLAGELGLTPLFAGLPGGLVRWGGWLGDRLGVRIRGAGDLSLTRAARLALEDNPYPAERAREALGWKPPFTLEQALARTGRWIRDHEATRQGRGS